MTGRDIQRLLVAEDDARWMNALIEAQTANFTITSNLADAMALIDRRRRWNAAVFDRYLLEGDLPFKPGRLVSEAGFLLAVAFKQKFPDCRVCICSGDPDTSTLPVHLKTLLKSDSVAYIYKGSKNAVSQLKRFLHGQSVNDNTISMLDHLLLQPNFCGIGIDLRAVIESIIKYCRRRGSNG